MMTINHSTQLDLFKMKLKEFLGTKSLTATQQANKYLDRHNKFKQCKFLVEPVGFQYAPDRSSILMSYIPHDRKEFARQHANK